MADEMASRTAKVTRTTKETDISVEISLDGTGQYDVSTGIGFLDHMLEQLSRHSLIDMTISAKGDTHIDFHHTTEDVGIAIGQALTEALGDFKGIRRYSDIHIPMDETLTRAAIDISGRPFIIWNVNFTRDKLGEFDTELFEEFFRALAMNGGLTLHIENIYGRNNHHIAETCFKATARALRAAIEIDPRTLNTIPSTKGQIGS